MEDREIATYQRTRPFGFRHAHHPCGPNIRSDHRRSNDAHLRHQHLCPAIAGGHERLRLRRSQNPTRFAFERCVADLEEGKAGFAFASGLAAIATVLELLEHGSHVVVCDDLYGGSFRLFERVRRRSANLDFTYVDPTDLAALEAAIRPNTRMIWMESPSNPLLKLVDLQAVAALAKRRGLLAAIDNTFASPYCQRPLTCGFDIVVHSVTKYLNGHSDMIGGIAVVGNNRELEEQLRFLQNAVGGISGPFDSFLALRGSENAGRAHGTTLPERPADRRVAGTPVRRCASHLSRSGKPSATRLGTAANGRLWRDGVGRDRRRSGTIAAFSGVVPHFHLGGKPGRRGKPDRASRPDDPCLDPRQATCRHRHRRRAGAIVRWHRARRRSDRRSRPGPSAVRHQAKSWDQIASSRTSTNSPR